MKRMTLHHIKFFIVLISTTICITSTLYAQVVCNKFKLNTKVTGSTLDLSVDTDLPDNTVVMVSVSRTYLEKGDSAKHCLYYLKEKSTIKKWKSKQKINISDKKWKSELKAKRKKLSSIGIGIDITSISKKITVGMVVPINQPDPKFGKQNSKLTGKAISTAGYRVIRGKIEIDYPLDKPSIGKSLTPILNPSKLEIGQIYILSKKTPLMPSHSPADPIAALKQMKQIPKDGMFKVIKRFKKGNTPWYKVIAINQKKKEIGTGWINSTALFGQNLKAYK